MVIVQKEGGFDSILVRIIDETMKYCLGEANTAIIMNYLESRGLPMNEIPIRPEQFSDELRNIMGFGSRQIMGAAVILEETMLEFLCKKLEIQVSFEKPVNFPVEIRKLREECVSRR